MTRGTSQAVQLPLFGRSPGSGTVVPTQSATAGGGSSGALSSHGSTSVQGAYRGSTPTGDNTGTVLPLTLDYALKLGLRNNLGAITENQTVRQAEGQRGVARSGLLPQANTVIRQWLGRSISSTPARPG